MKFILIAYYDKQLQAFLAPQAINSSSPDDIKTDVTRGLLKQLPKDKFHKCGPPLTNFVVSLSAL